MRDRRDNRRSTSTATGICQGSWRPLRVVYREAHDSRLQRATEVPKAATGDAGEASRFRSMRTALAHEQAVAVLGHPAGTGEMGVVDMARAVRLALGIEAEQDRDGLAPVGAVGRRVEQAHVELHVLTVIGRERRALRRFIEKLYLRHLSPQSLNITARVPFVNRAFDGQWEGRWCIA